MDLRDTIEYPQIYFEKGSGLRPVIDQMFEEIGQFPKVAFEMEEDSSMAGLVAQGFGIAVMYFTASRNCRTDDEQTGRSHWQSR